jgi:hypothetical protein
MLCQVYFMLLILVYSRTLGLAATQLQKSTRTLGPLRHQVLSGPHFDQSGMVRCTGYAPVEETPLGYAAWVGSYTVAKRVHIWFTRLLTGAVLE